MKTNSKPKLKDFIFLQGAFVIFSLASVVQKLASHEPFLSFNFICLTALAVFILAVYALLWQQVIKRFELSVAYANKAVSLLWVLLWGAFLFEETITLAKVAGVVVVIVGVVIMNTGGKNP